MQLAVSWIPVGEHKYVFPVRVIIDAKTISKILQPAKRTEVVALKHENHTRNFDKMIGTTTSAIAYMLSQVIQTLWGRYARQREAYEIRAQIKHEIVFDSQRIAQIHADTSVDILGKHVVQLVAVIHIT
ncbi:unnamed protein product [Heterobilharzia americana]|nr:unnamed protein product [Heterobilharzia americana]